MDELLIYGYFRFYVANVINIYVPACIIPIFHGYYHRNYLEIFGLKETKNNELGFQWASNGFHELNDTTIKMNDIKPFSMHNIRQYLSKLLGMPVIPNKYPFILYDKKW